MSQAAGQRASTTGTGKLTTDTAKACVGAEVPERKPGNSGQVSGAVSIGVVLDAIIAAIRIAIAQ